MPRGPGEPGIVKTMPNAFDGTGLDEQLKEFECGELIIAGFMTHMCVGSTARAASEFAYRVTMVADADATRDPPNGRGRVVKAEDLHRAERAALADRQGPQGVKGGGTPESDAEFVRCGIKKQTSRDEKRQDRA